MERIDTPFVLDAALLLVLLLGSIGGLWRGLRRELYVSLGLLLGYALTVSWATPWAADLRDLWSISAGRAHFLVATLLVALPAALIGLLGPRVAERAAPDFAGRVGGALLAIVDIVFAVAVVGGWARDDLLGSSAERDVEGTRIVGRVTEEFDLVVLAAAAAALGLLLGSLWVQRRRREQFRRATPLRAPDARVHRREQPVLAPEAEKVEPRPTGADGWTSRTSTRPPDVGATVPLPVIHETSRNGGSAAPPSPAGTSSPEWLTVASTERRSEQVDRCLTCGERVTDADRFCPRCGRTLV